jgi:hypothetical protein
MELYLQQLTECKVGVPYCAFLRATNVVAGPVFFFLTSITGPDGDSGLTWAYNTGCISGTPTKAGTYTLQFDFHDGQPGAFQTWGNGTVTITVAANAGGNGITITLDSAVMVINQDQSIQASASGGTAPYIWSAAALPPGTSIDPSTGLITGKPTTPGNYTATVTATDSASPTVAVSVQRTYQVTAPGQGDDYGGGVPTPPTEDPPAAAEPVEEGQLRWTQLRLSARKGPGTKGQSFGGGETTEGHAAVYDAHGNIIDAGVPPGGGGIWGSITGNMADQEDLQTALATKAPLSALAATFGHGGDGSDGDVSFNGTTAYSAFASLVASVYTLSRDIYAARITIAAGVAVKTNNFRVFCSGNVTINGTLANNGADGGNGNNAAGATGGTGPAGGGRNAGASAGTVGGNVVTNPAATTAVGGVAGKNGTTGGGANGSAGNGGQFDNSYSCYIGNAVGLAGAAGGSGGSAGAAGGGVGGAGGYAVNASVAARALPRSADRALAMNPGDFYYSTLTHYGVTPNPGGGGGGASGAGDGAVAGGGGGASGANGGAGGHLVVAAATITVGASGVICSDGGIGGNGGDGGSPASGTAAGGGGGAGGSGGSGGSVILIYKTLANSGAIRAAGGSGGSGGAKGTGRSNNDGTAGAAGTAGRDGVVILIAG